MSRLKTEFSGITMKNPVIAASGTFGFGREYDQIFDIQVLGGIACKAVTLEPRAGNPPPRAAETPGGMLNSVGLQNPGVENFIRRELPWLRRKDLTVIANVAGYEIEDYVNCVKLLDTADVDLIELNISCPNVKEGGMAFGTSPKSAAQITKAVRGATKLPLMVKLSPNVTSISEIALAVESEGADAVSLINTITGMRVDIRTRRPILHNNTGGLSGPALLPVALRMVYEVYRSVKIPVVGMGGISCAEDAIEMMLCGATAIQVGTALFTNPLAAVQIVEGLAEYAQRQNLQSIGELTGQIKPW